MTRFIPNFHVKQIWEPDFFDGFFLVGKEKVTKLGRPIKTFTLQSRDPVFADVPGLLLVYENSSKMIHFIGETGELLLSRRL